MTKHDRVGRLPSPWLAAALNSTFKFFRARGCACSMCGRSTVRVLSLARGIAARWRMLWFAIAAILGMLALPVSGTAQEGYWAWAPLGVGCARSISVGPNGVPWILGCTGGDPNGTGPAWVYYLSWSHPPGSLFPQYRWNYDNMSVAANLYVNLNGVPYVSDNLGNVWKETGDYPGWLGGDEEPIGSWGLARPCCVGSIAVSVTSTVACERMNNTCIPLNAGEMFYPLQNLLFNPGTTLANTTMFGVGCPSPITDCAGGPFLGGMWDATYQIVQMEPWAPGLTLWSPLPLASFLPVVALTMFTNPDDSGAPNAQDVQQTPWALDLAGHVYQWQLGQWVQAALPPGEIAARSISDSALLGESGGLYMCFYQPPCTAPGAWTYLIGPYTTNGDPVSLKEIATGGWVSQSIAGLSPAAVSIRSLPPYNPIAWAIDYDGNIYFSKWVYIGPSQ